MPDPRYFGLSISGIASVRAAMGAAGMLASDMLASGESQIEFPDWRHVPPEKLDGTPFHPDCYYPAEVCTPEQIAYMDALDGVRRYRPEGNSGIQTWKLRSNDYWIVNADECAEALQAWASVEPERRHAIIESVVAEDIAESGSGWIEAMGNICGSDGDDPRDVRLEPLVVTPCGRYPTVAAFVAVWFDWLAFLRLGAEGDGFMVE